MTDDNRPDPDSLLDLVSHDRSLTSRGRLKLFFGASAGVGKTYAMLGEAKRLLGEGLDVVVGVVETHGRSETEALAAGIPKLAPRAEFHRGIRLEEFDLEAALARKPSLILVDELAHTNAPFARHPKRWQDVEELLANGIDVYTTLNVQHLESINDMVAKLTGVLVRETVPDSVFDEADDVALIDIPSDELLKRLSEGKVYITEGANRRAAENFFKKSNLIALRELALRRTAERVDAEGDELTAARGQREAQLAQKILVCVGHDPLSAQVIRHAKRMAIRAKAQWAALYVETARHEVLSEQAKRAADRNLRLAEKLGAQIVRVTGSRACDEILSYAQSNGFTRIVVGHQVQGLFTRLTRGALATDLIAAASGLEITTVTEEAKSAPAFSLLSWRGIFAYPSRYGLAACVLIASTLLGLPLRTLVNVDILTMLYLTAVVIIAAWLGTGPSILASFASVVLFNLVFANTRNFLFSDQRYYFTFAMMLVTSLIVGQLASKLSLQARQSRRREAETNSLYVLTRELSALRRIDNMAEAALKHIREAFGRETGGMDAVIFRLKDGVLLSWPENSPARDLKEESVARWVLQNGQAAGRTTDTLPSARGLYVPMIAEEEILGVLGLIPPTMDHEFSSATISQLETFASLIASAFGRARRADEAVLAKVESEGEKLRNVLLSSVSHDLRTPLASITGAASSALMLEGVPKAARDLLASIHAQAARLARLVTNLLDATSLEAGTVRLNRQPYYIAEVIGSALTRIAPAKGARTIGVEIEPGLPLIGMDGLLIEQVFVNLLENAIRHTQEDGHITITVAREADVFRVRVSDDGCGLPAGEEARIFEKFYTREAQRQGAKELAKDDAKNTARPLPGETGKKSARAHEAQSGASVGNVGFGNVGLGLAICRGIITAHGGIIFAKNNRTGGASFVFTLPDIYKDAAAA